MASNGIGSSYPTRNKSSRNIPASFIKPLFDINEQQAFLLRTLEPYEKSLVNRWVNFCRSNLDTHAGTVSDLAKVFLSQMVDKGFDGGYINGRGKDSKLLFQNLFVYVPKIGVAAALMRICGNNITPTKDERFYAFREVVKMHRENYGDDKLPDWPDFKKYHIQRLFLPQTGILVPSIHSFRQYLADPSLDRTIEAFYKMHFVFPDEMTQEQLELGLNKKNVTTKDIVDNYRRVYEWMRELNPTLEVNVVPSRVDINSYTKAHQNVNGLVAVTWSQYQYWFDNPTNQDLEVGTERSLAWLRSQLGFVGDSARVTRKQRPQRLFWDIEKIKRHYIATWKFENPKGFNSVDKILRDPPTATRLEALGKIQTAIINQHGRLVPEVCDAYGVPVFVVPVPDTIRNHYPGGQQKLLRDIEVEYGDQRVGIVFTNQQQLSEFNTWYLRSGKLPQDVPMAIARFIPSR